LKRALRLSLAASLILHSAGPAVVEVSAQTRVVLPSARLRPALPVVPRPRAQVLVPHSGAPRILPLPRPAAPIPAFDHDGLPEPKGKPTALGRLKTVGEVLPTPVELGRISPAETREAGDRVMDHVLGLKVWSRPEAIPGPGSEGGTGLGRHRINLNGERASVPRPVPTSPLSLIERIGVRIARFVKVLPDPERNRQYWKIVSREVTMALLGCFHYSALDKMVAPRGKQDAANVSVARGVGWTAQAAASYGAGLMIDSASERKMMSWTSALRGAALTAVPVILFATGSMSLGVFLPIFALSGILQSVGNMSSSLAFNRVLAADEKQFNRANAILGLGIGISGIVGPLIAGTFVAMAGPWAAAAFGLGAAKGALAGAALAYGVYGAGLIGIAAGIDSTLKIPKNELYAARKELEDSLRKDGVLDSRVKRVSVEIEDGVRSLVIELKVSPAEAQDLPEKFGQFPVKRIAQRRQFKEMLEGFRLIWKDPFLRWAILLSVPYLFAADAIIWVGLQGYVRDILGASASAISPGLATIPVIGSLLAALTSKQGAFGIYLSASALGGVLAAPIGMMLESGREKGEGKNFLAKRGIFKKYDKLEFQAFWTSVLFGVGMLPMWLVFFSPNLWISVGAMILASFLQGPASVVWQSLRQRVIKENHRDSMGKILSAIFFLELVVSIAGAGVLGWMMSGMATGSVLWVICSILTVIAVLEIIEPFLVLPTRRRPK
jgi:hypothetical protein